MGEREFCVAADIGGTNLSLALAERRDGKATVAYRARYRSQEERGIGPPLKRFLAEAEGAGFRGRLRSACLAGAGVASESAIAMSNVPWVLEAEEAARALGCPVLLVNDFRALLEGIAARCPADRGPPDKAAFLPLMPAFAAPALPSGSLFAAIGPGTGLGMGFAIAGEPLAAYPSEGGNIRFPAWDEDSFALMEWMRSRLGREACAEDWVSGIGLGLSFEFEAERAGRPSGAAARVLAAAPAERAALVAAGAADDALCARVMGRFWEAFAACAADAALTFLPRALFLAGGITAKNAWALAGGAFLGRFLAHGKPECAAALAATPVFAVLDYDIGLYGAAELAVRG